MVSTLRFVKHLALILLVLVLREVNIAFVPPPVVAHTDIVYGQVDEKHQSMDIYYPRKAAKIKEPVGAFLVIHGGSWIAGSKEEYRMFAVPLAKEGYVTASTNYRFKPRINDKGEVTTPGFTAADMMEDIGLAIQKLKETAAADGIEIDKLALLGDSAGAHLALLYAYSHPNGTADAPAIPIAFVVARSAPVTASADNAFPGDYSMDMNVMHHVTKDAPPTILCYATHDELVDPAEQSIPLRDRLTELKVPVECFVYEHAGHALLHLLDMPTHKISYDEIFAWGEKYL